MSDEPRIGTAERKAWQEAKNTQARALLGAARLLRMPITPAKTRQQLTRDRLKEAGGRGLSINLSPQAAADLAAIRAHHEIETDRATVETALRYMASKLRKK